jgi:uncharacterized damage-inducible protein DinB
MQTETDLRYPIGKFHRHGELNEELRHRYIDDIERMPARLREGVKGLTEAQLDTPYRPGGWTVRQLVHHIADSHMNAYVRVKLALTEDQPLIKPYLEAKWAELQDSKTLPVEVSLNLLDSLHQRWVKVLLSMIPAEFSRVMRHPDWAEPMSLDDTLALYAWHGKHHLAHITELRRREGWLGQ